MKPFEFEWWGVFHGFVFLQSFSVNLMDDSFSLPEYSTPLPQTHTSPRNKCITGGGRCHIFQDLPVNQQIFFFGEVRICPIIDRQKSGDFENYDDHMCIVFMLMTNSTFIDHKQVEAQLDYGPGSEIGVGWEIGVTWSRKRGFKMAATELGYLLTKLSFWLVYDVI